MPEIGQTVSHYRILEKIGVGGMGEVYLAEDLSLDRKVALKFLPDVFTGDPERMARFEREAKLLASLNHPNIAGIYGLEQADGKRFLVLEYVEGETLQARLSKEPLPIEEALAVCRQIAEGLEAAHEKGIIHRDLKPANVIITAEEKVKILDFGLAKAWADEVQSTESSHSPTITEAMTQPGVILGTAAYMSPEQAKGKSIDKRADIWAFGCILYECLTGKRTFVGETLTETLAAVLKNEPDWRELSDAMPRKIHELVERCLRKDPAWRLHDIADARIDIDDAQRKPQAQSPVARIGPRGLAVRIALFIAAAGIIGIISGRLWLRSTPTIEKSLIRFKVSLPEGQSLGGPSLPFNISPDGNRLVYVAQIGTMQQLCIRELDEFAATLLPGTEGASNPFFSPDGRWIGFYANADLKKISIEGGAVTTICEAPKIIGQGWGGGSYWGLDDTIIFSGGRISGLMRVSAGGGTPELLAIPEGLEGQLTWPQMMPDLEHILFTVNTGDDSKLCLFSMDTGETRELLSQNVNNLRAQYLPTGHILYAHSGGLWAVAFDEKSLEFKGSPVSVLDGVYEIPQTVDTTTYFAVADNGSLIYMPGPVAGKSSFIWLDREGKEIPWVEEENTFSNPRLSPDGSRVAVVVVSSEGNDIWVYEVDRGIRTRLTFGGSNLEPVWSSDGTHLAFSKSPYLNLQWIPADGSGPAQPLLEKEEGVQLPSSCSPDGRILAFYEINAETSRDIWEIPVDGDRVPKPILATKFSEHSAMFSPDGKWLAYVSDESGCEEIYVRPYPGPGGKHTISNGGGREPVWSSGGREIFYRNGDKMMVVAIQTEFDFTAGNPRVLFEEPYAMWFGGGNNYDVTPDGQRILMIRRDLESSPRQINVIINWFEELKEKVPVE